MEYSIRKLAGIAGISSRALRYYDEIGILKPARLSSSGYRIYGSAEIDRLQQILFYRELGVGLEKIKEILSDPEFDGMAALRQHREQLLKKRRQLDLLISNVEKTILRKEGMEEMMDEEMFEGFIETLIDDNEKKYGEEIRKKYGKKAVEESNHNLKHKTQEEFQAAAKVEVEMLSKLRVAMKTGDPGGQPAQEAAELHKQWLSFYWVSYSREAHAGLAQMYVDDERFKAYYDAGEQGTAEFLRDAVMIFIRLDNED
ncbi:MerR family transcriptional regulator [Peribacillus sp. SCS-26]|uniref:MerR family transcriptional regulator n=1 Tax=Paraperibacillus marinus TaxID=3115295 RepID=UPI0039068A4E